MEQQGLRDDESYPLDRGAAKAALLTIEPLVKRMNTDAIYYASTLPPTSGELAAGAIDEWDDGDGEVNFVQALLIRQILVGRLEDRSLLGDVALQQSEQAQVIIRHGSLSVRGSLNLHAMLMVLGHLQVSGRIADLVKASRLVVTNNLTCRTLRIGSPFWVGGDVDAQAVCFDPGGKLWVGGELRAKVVIGSPQSGGVTGGGLRVSHYSPSSEWEQDSRASLAKLQTILAPGAFQHADVAKGIFQPNDLLDLVDAGQPYLS